VGRFTFYPVMRPFYSHEAPPSGWSAPAVATRVPTSSHSLSVTCDTLTSAVTASDEARLQIPELRQKNAKRPTSHTIWSTPSSDIFCSIRVRTHTNSSQTRYFTNRVWEFRRIYNLSAVYRLLVHGLST